MNKLLSVFIILICLLTACSKESNRADNTSVQNPGGYKPIIFYHGKLYGIEDFTETLPNNYIDSGDKIIASEKDAYTLPSKECYTTSFNSHNVGAIIYVDPNDEDTIYINAIKKENVFIMFVYNPNEY